jgi:hypothetical protein
MTRQHTNASFGLQALSAEVERLAKVNVKASNLPIQLLEPSGRRFYVSAI